MRRTSDDQMLAQIQEQKRRLNERAQKIHARKRKQERTDETRQKVLLGAFLRTWMDRDDDMRRRVMTGLDRYLTRDIDRVQFGLELHGDGTLKDSSDSAPEARHKKDAAAAAAALQAAASKAKAS